LISNADVINMKPTNNLATLIKNLAPFSLSHFISVLSHWLLHTLSIHTTMSPIAIYTPAENVTSNVPPTGTSPLKGSALVIGSLSTAEDGKYQSVITELESTRKVEKLLLDRIMDEGMLRKSYLLRVVVYLQFKQW
jgi:hypothetical protein